MAQTAKLKQMRWCLRIMMAKRDITTVTALRRRLLEIGVEISSQQLTRIVSEFPQKLNTEVLIGLCTVLECGPGDLIEIIEEPAESGSGGVEDPPKRKRARRPSLSDAELELADDAVGPRITPFPKPAK